MARLDPLSPPSRLKLACETAVFAIAVLASLALPHWLLSGGAAWSAALAQSLAYTGLLLAFARGGDAGRRVIGASATFLAVGFSSACVGVFFHLPLKSAWIAFFVIAVCGAVVQVAILGFLAFRIFPHVLSDGSDEDGKGPSSDESRLGS